MATGGTNGSAAPNKRMREAPGALDLIDDSSTRPKVPPNPGGGAARGVGGGGGGASATPQAQTWNAAEWARAYRRALSDHDKQLARKLLRDVSEHNYKNRFLFGPIPKTMAVPIGKALSASLSGAAAAASSSSSATRRREPLTVTFSPVSTCDAIFHFAQDPRRKVCAMNFANGAQPGGGYKTGAVAQEEDLCRRIPQLYSSLWQAQTDRLYPFGPCTATSTAQPNKYSDVLYTDGLQLGRLSSDDGFEVLRQGEQVTCSIVSAAAPNLGKKELIDLDLLYRTVEAVFRVPKLVEPDVNTLVLGAWGCGAFLCNPAEMSTLFAKALSAGGLGELYDEVHFAILSASQDDKNLSVFKETFKRHGLPFSELGYGTGRAAASPRASRKGSVEACQTPQAAAQRPSALGLQPPQSGAAGRSVTPNPNPMRESSMLGSALSGRKEPLQPASTSAAAADSAWGEGSSPRTTAERLAKPPPSTSPKGRQPSAVDPNPNPLGSSLSLRSGESGATRRLGNSQVAAPAPAAAQSAQQPQWEIGWSDEERQYFFLDRVSGLSQWERPAGCNIPIPERAPSDSPKVLRHMPTELPPGWEMSFDPKHKKHYFYNHSTGERTWKHPGMEAAMQAATARPVGMG